MSQAQLGVAVPAREEFPIEARNDHRLAVLGSGVDDQLLDEVAFVGLDTGRNTVITDAQYDSSTLRVGHARKYLGKPGRGTPSVTTKLHPVAPESYLLQLQCGVLTGTNRGHESGNVHGRHVRSNEPSGNLTLMTRCTCQARAAQFGESR